MTTSYYIQPERLVHARKPTRQSIFPAYLWVTKYASIWAWSKTNFKVFADFVEAMPPISFMGGIAPTKSATNLETDAL